MAPSFKDAVKKAAKKKTTKSKSKTPDVMRDDLNEAIEKWLEAHKMEKDSKALKAQAEAAMLDDIEDERVKACRTDGEFHSAVKVNGKVTVSVQSRYSPIGTEVEEEIKEIAGEKYDEFFKEQTSVALTAAALADETLLGRLMEAVGEDFERYFEVKQAIVPTKAFHEQRATSPEVGEVFNKLRDEGLVKPYKASVKRA